MAVYKNPKNSKQEIKLWAFYLMDIAVVAASFMIASLLVKILNLSGVLSIAFEGLFVICGIYLCIQSPTHPTQRNYVVLKNMFLWDRNNYHQIDEE